MKITRSEIIRMEIDDMLDTDALNRVENILNDICCSLGEQSNYNLINRNRCNVISSENIRTALMVIDALLLVDHLDAYDWIVERKE